MPVWFGSDRCGERLNGCITVAGPNPYDAESLLRQCHVRVQLGRVFQQAECRRMISAQCHSCADEAQGFVVIRINTQDLFIMFFGDVRATSLLCLARRGQQFRCAIR